MTNQEIIFETSLQLMREGKLKGTGKFLRYTVTDADGNEQEREVELPEPIHTFAAWKDLGFKVKKGEHSSIKLRIWKYVAGKASEAMDDGMELEGDNGHCIMKTAFFFTRDQVERMEA